MATLIDLHCMQRPLANSSLHRIHVYDIITDNDLYVISLDESELQPVYGCPLEDHLRIQERDIAFVIEECATFLYREAMDIQVSLISFQVSLL